MESKSLLYNSEKYQIINNYYNCKKNEDSEIWAKFSEKHLASGQEDWLGVGFMGL